jgi:hypothetical protein
MFLNLHTLIGMDRGAQFVKGIFVYDRQITSRIPNTVGIPNSLLKSDRGKYYEAKFRQSKIRDAVVIGDFLFILFAFCFFSRCRDTVPPMCGYTVE